MTAAIPRSSLDRASADLLPPHIYFHFIESVVRVEKDMNEEINHDDHLKERARSGQERERTGSENQRVFDHAVDIARV